MKQHRFASLRVTLPTWITEVLPERAHRFTDDEEKMRLALTLGAENVRRQSGGPFGAAIFDGESGRLVSVGVNMVVPSNWSGAHAEMVAFAVAQQELETYDLGAPGMPAYELFSSTEPCAMCLGATFWSGVRRVACSARGADAERIGFDEGPKPTDWVGELERRGIAVTADLLREEGRAVLEEYRRIGGVVYNGRGDDAL
jgi:tRNA(Arg) A34 adenosine deaminase TadA